MRIAVRDGVMRWGSVTGTRVPIRMIFHVGDFMDLREDPVQNLVFEKKGVSSGDQNVADFFGGLDIGQGLIEFFGGDALFAFPHHAAAGAVPAVDGALIRHQQKDTVRIPMDEMRDRGIFILRAGIQKIGGGKMKFIQRGNGLTPDRTIRVLTIHQFGKIWRDRRGQPSFGSLNRLDFFLAQI